MPVQIGASVIHSVQMNVPNPTFLTVGAHQCRLRSFFVRKSVTAPPRERNRGVVACSFNNVAAQGVAEKQHVWEHASQHGPQNLVNDHTVRMSPEEPRLHVVQPHQFVSQLNRRHSLQMSHERLHSTIDPFGFAESHDKGFQRNCVFERQPHPFEAFRN